MPGSIGSIFDLDGPDRMTKNQTDCNVIPSPNSTAPLAPKWENIPETLLLNASIGAVLLIIFMALSRYAWMRSNREPYINRGWIDLLYGYREPERWYVIPRLEFLRLKGRRHMHDLRDEKICVPPNFPFNPMKPFNYTHPNEATKSSESISIKNASNHQADSTKDQLQTKTSPEEPMHLASSDTLTNYAWKSRKSFIPKPQVSSAGSNPLDPAFYYPTVLAAETHQATFISRKLNCFFGIFFRVSDADIIYDKGIDAYEYLLFQRHLILIMFVVNIFCLGLILPIHWYASDESMPYWQTSLKRTTIKNVDANSRVYWAHIVSCVSIILVTYIALSSYRNSIITKNETQLARRTLLIGNIHPKQRSRKELSEILQINFSDAVIEGIQFVYDTSELERYQWQLDSTMKAKEYCDYVKERSGQDIWVKTTDVTAGCCRACSYFYVSCCKWPCESTMAGSEYYSLKERVYRDKIRRSCEKLIARPCEYAFVTFRSHRQARRVLDLMARLKAESATLSQPLDGWRGKSRDEPPPPATNQYLVTKLNKNQDPLDPANDPHVRSIRVPSPSDSAASTQLTPLGSDPGRSSLIDGPLRWSIRYAPHPDNIDYGDLLNISSTSRLTIISLHVLMIIIFIFVTTPNVVLSIVEKWSLLHPEKAEEVSGIQSLFINYFSIFVQLITTALLPSLIILISKQIPYEDASSKNHAIMWKVYFFLILMVIVMPSIGMSSAQALISSDIVTKCLFPTDNGAYYINYVISSIFLSTIIELIKPLEILAYAFSTAFMRSEADFEVGRLNLSKEFSVDMNHTYVLLIFSAVMTYCLSCPMIAPAGLLYLLVKHSADHYHLYYTYFTKKVDSNTQRTVEIFVAIALLLMLFQTTISIQINAGFGHFSWIMQLIFWTFLFGAMISCFCDCLSGSAVSPPRRGKHHREYCACFYLPRVIDELLRLKALPSSCYTRLIRG